MYTNTSTYTQLVSSTLYVEFVTHTPFMHGYQ